MDTEAVTSGGVYIQASVINLDEMLRSQPTCSSQTGSGRLGPCGSGHVCAHLEGRCHSSQGQTLTTAHK